MMRATRFHRRFLQFRLRTLMIATVALGFAFGHVAHNKQLFDREQQAMARIPGLSVARPEKGYYRTHLVAKLDQSWQRLSSIGKPRLPWKAWPTNLAIFG